MYGRLSRTFYQLFFSIIPKNKTFRVSTIESKNDLLYDNMQNFTKLKSKNIILEGDIGNELIDIFHYQNVKFVVNIEYILKNNACNSNKLKFIIVGSKKKRRLCELYNLDNQQYKEISKTIKKSEDIPNSLLVDDYESLSKEILNSRNEKEKIILVFNNDDSKTLFGKKLNDIDVDDMITCNSFNISSKTSFQSTDFLYFSDVIESLKNTYKNEKVFMLDFYSDFIESYNFQLQIRKSKNATIVVVATGGTGIGTGAIIYYNFN